MTNTTDMRGKTVVITGATSGIGQVAAVRLAAHGARLVLVARDQRRGQETLDQVRASGPGIDHSIHYADLFRLREMKRVATEIGTAEPRIDVLINNAGAIFGRRVLTDDGLERTFALNHLAYFVVTALLRPRLIASAPARVISTSSGAHSAGRIDFDDLQSAKAFRGGLLDYVIYGGPGFKVYARSKLLNVLFTRELARHLAGTGVTANCLHPGFVATRFGESAEGFQGFTVNLAKHVAISPERGADTLVYLASSPDVAGVTGQYFYKRHPVEPSRGARDDEAARRLWTETARLANIPE
jgi:NAD(P)-dependent dehydrogenase (short-subunit alcohol dehydrogenase family)